jgi:hypothetical protein
MYSDATAAFVKYEVFLKDEEKRFLAAERKRGTEDRRNM